MDGGLRGGICRHPSSMWQGKVVVDLHRIHSRRDVQHVGPLFFWSVLLAEQIVGAILCAMEKPVVAGEAYLAMGPQCTRGDCATFRKPDVIFRPVIFGHHKADRELSSRRAPGHGGKGLPLAREVRHHVEVIDILGDKCGIRLDINQREIFVASVGQYLAAAYLQLMRGIRPHQQPYSTPVPSTTPPGLFFMLAVVRTAVCCRQPRCSLPTAAVGSITHDT